MDLFTELGAGFIMLERLMPPESLRAFLEAGYDGIPGFLFGLGGYVRNTLLREQSPLTQCFIRGGVHSLDDMSHLFLRLFFIHLAARRQDTACRSV